MSPLSPKEIEIPVPWGHIAVKLWGNPCSRAVLAVHDLGANASSFDCLAPLLAHMYHCVCVDLPGHGRSSRFPPGLPLDFMDHAMAIKRVVDHLQLDHVCFLGHGLGAHLALYFSVMQPMCVEKLVMVDDAYLLDEWKGTYREMYDSATESLLKMEKQGPKTYTYSEALHTMLNEHKGCLTVKAAEILLQRCLIKLKDDLFHIQTDPRLEGMPIPMLSLKEQGDLLASARCQLLFVTTDYMPQFADDKKIEALVGMLSQIPNSRYCKVIGSHYTHIEDPETLGHILMEFLK